MKPSRIFLICTFALVFASAATAQPAQETSSTESAALETTSEETTVSGTVVSATSTQLVIDSDEGERMSFALDPTSTTQFAVDDRVTVAYHSETGGTVQQAVSVAAEPSLPATAGNLPLIGLLGLLAVGGAVAVRGVSAPAI